MKKILYLLCFSIVLFASQPYQNLPLQKAIEIIKNENIEVSIADMDVKIKQFEAKIAKGYSYGKLDLIQSIMRSNDAGNVFGFKLSNREASFADFGFDEFLYHWGAGSSPSTLLSTQPQKLNYPDARNYFQTKLEYMAPLYTGGKLEQYEKITQSLAHLASLDKQKIITQKIYEVKKSYQDIALLESFIKNLQIIEANIQKLEDMAQNMLQEGYAKNVDVLEVQSKKANVIRMLSTTKANQELVYHFLSFLLNHEVESVSTSLAEESFDATITREDIEKNIDIQKVLKAKEITSMALQVQKANLYPEAGFFAQYESSDDTFLGDFASHDSYTVGVQVKLNLFNGGIDEASIERAKVEDMKLSQQIVLAKNGIWLQVSKIVTEIKSLEFEIDSLKKELELNRAIYENYLGRYQEKLVSINDVIIKQSLEIEQLLKLKEVQNRRSDKIYELQKILGGENL